MADALTLQRVRLLRRGRVDMGLGLVAGLLLALFLWRGRLDRWLLPSLLGTTCAAMLYVPLRLKPRRAALDEVRARQELIDPRCPQCGYTLRHLQHARCPECGRRVRLPSARDVREALSGGPVAVAKGSIATELGWVVGMLMLLTAVCVGRWFGAVAAWCSSAVLPLFVLVLQAVGRHRQAIRVSPLALCDRCEKPTSVHVNRCEHCRARLLADHVYVRPGHRGWADPRLYCSQAQLLGGLCVGLMLVINGLSLASRWAAYVEHRHWVLLLQFGLIAGAIGWLRVDLRMARRDRLERFDTSSRALCHHCLATLNGQFANGTCPSCEKAYRGIELAGGLGRVAPPWAERGDGLAPAQNS